MKNKLLALLNQNARYTAEELAVMLGTDILTVGSLLGELQNDKIICGYKTLIDWDKVDNEHVTAIIELKVTPKRDFGFDELAEKVKSFENVETVYLMSGGFDLCVIVTGQSFQKVAMFVAKQLSTLDGVVSTGTHFVLKRYKELGFDMTGGIKDDRETYSL